MQLAFGTIIGRVLVSYIFIKPYYDYKVFSIYEYLTARFGVASKNAASAVFMITRLLASGARLYVAAIALALAYEMISGARPNQTQTLWIYVGATIAIVILTAIYTTFGGIKAVIWTDLIQASIMIGSALIALGLLYSAIPGGWHEIVERHGPFKVSDLIATGLDPARHGWDKVKGMFEMEYTIFAGLIGAAFITMGTHGTDQDMVQRMLTAKDIRRSRRSLICSALADIPIAFTFLSIGLLLVGLLSSPSRSDTVQDPERNILPFHSLSNAGGTSRIAPRGDLRHRHGIAQHCVERARHQFYARLVRALHQSRRYRRAKFACRAVGDHLVFGSDDHRCIDHGVSRYRASQRSNYSHRIGHFRLHLRLAPRCIFCGNANQDAAGTIAATSSP